MITLLTINNLSADLYYMRRKIIFAPLFELKFIKMQADMASYSRLQHTALWMQSQLNGGFLNMSPLKTIKLYRLHSAAISDGQYIDILNWMSLKNNAYHIPLLYYYIKTLSPLTLWRHDSQDAQTTKNCIACSITNNCDWFYITSKKQVKSNFLLIIYRAGALDILIDNR